MDKYENLGLVGEGSYGMVLRCRHKESGQLVAIKKFLESDDDKTVRKIALREIKLLKQLRHDNLVNLIDAFRRKKRVYLVFEFVHHTVLDELEQNPRGLDAEKVRQILWQLCRAIEFCHQHNVIHRDIKPENILISKTGIVKLCDFGFARTCAQQGEPYTDYVATRWYRAPELLVGDTKYGKPIDIWAIGCLVPELATGEPLFPGDSDIDQIYHIVRAFGNLSLRLQDIFKRNKLYAGTKLPSVKVTEPLETRFPQFTIHAMDFLKGCLRLNAEDRYNTAQLLKHDYFHHDGFAHKFSAELKIKIDRDIANNPLLREQKRHLMVTSAESGMSESTVGKSGDDQTLGSDPTPRVSQQQPHANLVPINELSSSQPPKTEKDNLGLHTPSQMMTSQSPAVVAQHHLPTVLALPQQNLHTSTPVSTLNHPSTPPPHSVVITNNNAANTKYSLNSNNSNGSLKGSKAGFMASSKPLKQSGPNLSNNNSPPSVYGITPPGAITGYGYQTNGGGGGYRQLGRTKEQQPGQGLDALPQLPDVVGTGSTISSRDTVPMGGGGGGGAGVGGGGGSRAGGARRLGQLGGQQSQNPSSVDIYANGHHAGGAGGGKETLPNI